MNDNQDRPLLCQNTQLKLTRFKNKHPSYLVFSIVSILLFFILLIVLAIKLSQISYIETQLDIAKNEIIFDENKVLEINKTIVEAKHHKGDLIQQQRHLEQTIGTIHSEMSNAKNLLIRNKVNNDYSKSLLTQLNEDLTKERSRNEDLKNRVHYVREENRRLRNQLSDLISGKRVLKDYLMMNLH